MSPINAFTISLIVSVAGYAYLKINALTAKFEELVDKVNDGDLREKEPMKVNDGDLQKKESMKVIIQLEDRIQLLERDLKHLRETRHDMTNLDSAYFDNVLDKQATVLDEHAKQISSSLDEASSLRASLEKLMFQVINTNTHIASVSEDVKMTRTHHEETQTLLQFQQSRQQDHLNDRIRGLVLKVSELIQRICDLECQQANLIDINDRLIQRICDSECTQASQ